MPLARYKRGEQNVAHVLKKIDRLVMIGLLEGRHFRPEE